MRRQLSVSINQGTWLPGSIAFPSGFHTGTLAVDFDISQALLLIGHLTTPTLASGVSLSELWAWVRYYYAIAGTNDLRLTREFAELDSHQKTILSDDFGMGIPMMWLIKPLELVAWCDGREFADRFSALTVPAASVPKKRGPSKSPDFICLDRHGKLHVIECKGTQSGSLARARQFTHTNAKGAASGGIVQKRTIVIQPSRRGQSLVCGLCIGRDGGKEASGLLIVDPDGEDTIVVDEGEENAALDPIIRATTARCLRAAGFPETADTIASPSGRRSDARPLTEGKLTRTQRDRQSFVEARRARASAELVAGLELPPIIDGEGTFVGRIIELDLPRPLQIDGETYTGIEIRQGVQKDLIQALMGAALEDQPVMEAAPWLPKRLQKIDLTGEGGFAQLTIGDMFRSQLRLKGDSVVGSTAGHNDALK